MQKMVFLLWVQYWKLWNSLCKQNKTKTNTKKPPNLPSTCTIKYDKANYSNESHHSARAFQCSRAVAFNSPNIDLGKLDLSTA